MKRVEISQCGRDKILFGFRIRKDVDLFVELTKEFFGIQHCEKIRDSKTGYKNGVKVYNGCGRNAESKKILIHYGKKPETDPKRKKKAHFRYDGIVQFIPTRWEFWTQEEIESVIWKLSTLVDIGYHTLQFIEFYVDTANLPQLPGWQVRFAKNYARSTSPIRPIEGGYTEGTQKRASGSLGKYYPKLERFFAHRFEIALSRRKLQGGWGCKTLGEALRLDPFTVLNREAHFIAVRDSDWPRIIRKPNRCKRIRRGFIRRGPAWICHSPIGTREKKAFEKLTLQERQKHFSLTSKRERKQFHKLKVKLAVHEVILAPGEIEMDEGSDA